jgi:hypothetical protein
LYRFIDFLIDKGGSKIKAILLTINYNIKYISTRRQSGLVVSDLTHDQKIVASNLVSSKQLDGNGFKAMPGSIPAPNSGSFENKKNTSSQTVPKEYMSDLL